MHENVEAGQNIPNLDSLRKEDRDYLGSYVSAFASVVNNSKNVNEVNKIITFMLANDMAPIAVETMNLFSLRFKRSPDFMLNYVNLLISAKRPEMALRVLLIGKYLKDTRALTRQRATAIISYTDR